MNEGFGRRLVRIVGWVGLCCEVEIYRLSLLRMIDCLGVVRGYGWMVEFRGVEAQQINRQCG